MCSNTTYLNLQIIKKPMRRLISSFFWLLILYLNPCHIMIEMCIRDRFTKGAPLGEGLGRLFVVAGMVDSPRVRDSFPERIPDHQILSVVDLSLIHIWQW